MELSQQDRTDFADALRVASETATENSRELKKTLATLDKDDPNVEVLKDHIERWDTLISRWEVLDTRLEEED